MSSTAAAARSRAPRIAEAAIEQARLAVVPRLRPPTPRVPFVALVSTLLSGWSIDASLSAATDSSGVMRAAKMRAAVSGERIV